MPTAYRKELAAKVSALKKSAANAKQAYAAARNATRGADGRYTVIPADIKAALSDANLKLGSAEANVTAAAAREHLFTKMLDFSPADAPRMSSVGAGLDGTARTLVDFMKEMPVIDFLASGVGTVFSAQ